MNLRIRGFEGCVVMNITNFQFHNFFECRSFLKEITSFVVTKLFFILPSFNLI